MDQAQKEFLRRAVKGYPHPKYHILFMAYAHTNSQGKAQTLCEIIKVFFDRMSQAERDRLNILWSEMTPEQRKNPKLL